MTHLTHYLMMPLLISALLALLRHHLVSLYLQQEIFHSEHLQVCSYDALISLQHKLRIQHLTVELQHY